MADLLRTAKEVTTNNADFLYTLRVTCPFGGDKINLKRLAHFIIVDAVCLDGQNKVPEAVSQLDYVFPCQDSIAANLPVGNFLAELWPTIIPVKSNLQFKVTNLP
nr:MAG TPA: hypothetical protein [Caudoviricetes sp.]